MRYALNEWLEVFLNKTNLKKNYSEHNQKKNRIYLLSYVGPTKRTGG